MDRKSMSEKAVGGKSNSFLCSSPKFRLENCTKRRACSYIPLKVFAQKRGMVEHFRAGWKGRHT